MASFYAIDVNCYSRIHFNPSKFKNSIRAFTLQNVNLEVPCIHRLRRIEYLSDSLADYLRMVVLLTQMAQPDMAQTLRCISFQCSGAFIVAEMSPTASYP